MCVRPFPVDHVTDGIGFIGRRASRVPETLLHTCIRDRDTDTAVFIRKNIHFSAKLHDITSDIGLLIVFIIFIIMLTDTKVIQTCEIMCDTRENLSWCFYEYSCSHVSAEERLFVRQN